MGQLLQSQAQPTQLTEEEDPNPQAAWWCKLLARGVGTIGASSECWIRIADAVDSLPCDNKFTPLNVFKWI